ncbi:MAG: type II secretion system protein GspG [Patescibacteria group bacterium]|nr:type II secretion system protein GspG [Patescibacteria group bacterium]
MIKKSFTLLELMIVIFILGVLAAMITGNFITSLKKGRDAKRKADLEEIKKALEMYYEDNKRYPTSLANAERKMCHPSGCDVKIYMEKVPVDPLTKKNYFYFTDDQGKYYMLYSHIENKLDTGEGVNQDGYPDTSCNNSNPCKYRVNSPNAPINQTVPIITNTHSPTITDYPSITPTFNISPPITPNTCGNNTLDPGEECDSTDQDCNYINGEICLNCQCVLENEY